MAAAGTGNATPPLQPDTKSAPGAVTTVVATTSGSGSGSGGSGGSGGGSGDAFNFKDLCDSEYVSELPSADRVTDPAEFDFLCGEYYANGTCSPYNRPDRKARDIKLAASHYKSAADRDHPWATFRLGRCLALGWGIEKNLNDSAKCFKRACELNVRDAHVSYAVVMWEGLGVEKSQSTGTACVLKAIELGSAWGSCNYGVAFEKGDCGESKDMRKAVEYYLRSADLGYFLGQYYIGLCYQEGLGVEKDESRAAHYFYRASRQGHAPAQLCLGLLFRRASPAIEQFYTHPSSSDDTYTKPGTPERQRQNDRKAISYYEMAAAQNYPVAVTNLGVCYENGWGVEKDEARAFQYYLKSANLGHGLSQYYCAIAYSTGTKKPKPTAANPDDVIWLIPRHTASAVYWWRRAAENATPQVEAQRDLAMCYRHGLAALALIAGSSQPPHIENSESELESFAVSEAAIDHGESYYWLCEASARGHLKASCELAECYANGWGCVKDLRKAAEQFRSVIDYKSDTPIAERWGDPIAEAKRSLAAMIEEHAKGIVHVPDVSALALPVVPAAVDATDDDEAALLADAIIYRLALKLS